MENVSDKLLKELNFVRCQPQEYAEKLQSYKNYFKGDILRIPGQVAIKTTEGFKAFEDAIQFLKKQSPLKPIIFNTYLTKIAEEAYSIIAASSDVDAANSINIDELISKHGQIAGQFSQAVDFGSGTAELAVINLLVDDGDLNRGNRSNFFNAKFSIAGIAHGPHKTFHHCTVITYARHFIPKGEDIGHLSDDCYEKPESSKAEVNAEKSGSKQKVSVSSSVIEEPKQIPKYVYANETKINDFDLPIGIEKMEIQEKMITEDGKKRKIVREKKYLKDGTIETNIYKVDV